MADIHKVKFEIAADDQATRIFQGVQRSIGSLQASYVALGAAISGGAVLTTFMARAIALRSALDDLSDITGDNVKTLDGLRRQAEVSGVSLDSLGTSLSHLARNLNAADDDGKAAGAAIQAIGLSIEELRAKKPGEALVEIANALNRFGDGSAKVAVAVALMGREGAKLLPYLKDLAESGELQGRITGEQAKAAEELEKNWRRLNQTAGDLGQTLATAAIPAMSDWLAANVEAVRIAGSLNEALRLFVFNLDAMTAEKPAEEIRRLTRALEEFRAAGPIGQFMQSPTGFIFGGREEDLRKQIDLLKYLQRQEALALPGAGEPDEIARRFSGRQVLDFRIPAKERGAREDDVAARQAAWAMEEEIQLMSEIAQLTDDQARKERENEEQRMKAWLEFIDQQQEYEIQVGQLQAGFDGMGNALEKVTKQSYNFGFTFNSALEDAIINGESLRNVMQALAKDIARAFIRRSVTDPLANALGGALGSILGGAIFGGGGEEIAAQHGADFVVGGSGGIDSQLVRFRATPGERVTVTPPGQSGGGITIVQNMSFGSDVNRSTLMAWGRQVKNDTLAAVAEATGRGGTYSSAVRG